MVKRIISGMFRTMESLIWLKTQRHTSLSDMSSIINLFLKVINHPHKTLPHICSWGLLHIYNRLELFGIAKNIFFNLFVRQLLLNNSLRWLIIWDGPVDTGHCIINHILFSFMGIKQYSFSGHDLSFASCICYLCGLGKWMDCLIKNSSPFAIIFLAWRKLMSRDYLISKY